MIKTLIIHPQDESTDFLSIIYKQIESKTVITGNVTKAQIQDLIQSHDRVMMMGHGTEDGLLSVGQFPEAKWLIIDYSMAQFLNKKRNSIFIWCNADGFVNYHKLKGFYTGMFISEVGEADYCGFVGSASQSVVDESNRTFCGIMVRHIKEDIGALYKNVVLEYGSLAQRSPIAKYNHKRIYAKF